AASCAVELRDLHLVGDRRPRGVAWLRATVEAVPFPPRPRTRGVPATLAASAVVTRTRPVPTAVGGVAVIPTTFTVPRTRRPLVTGTARPGRPTSVTTCPVPTIALAAVTVRPVAAASTVRTRASLPPVGAATLGTSATTLRPSAVPPVLPSTTLTRAAARSVTAAPTTVAVPGARAGLAAAGAPRVAGRALSTIAVAASTPVAA
ncbi:hypothetical protein ACFVQZ_36325, partial [Streptomyces sp. NPDC057854]